jgi:hypothetical protein
MGTSTPRSNVPAGTASGQVITPAGGCALRCVIDDTFVAEVLPGCEKGDVGFAHLADGLVELVRDDEVIARLVASDGIQRLTSCMARGHAYVGVVTSAQSVRIRNVS